MTDAPTRKPDLALDALRQLVRQHDSGEVPINNAGAIELARKVIADADAAAVRPDAPTPTTDAEDPADAPHPLYAMTPRQAAANIRRRYEKATADMMFFTGEDPAEPHRILESAWVASWLSLNHGEGFERAVIEWWHSSRSGAAKALAEAAKLLIDSGGRFTLNSAIVKGDALDSLESALSAYDALNRKAGE